MKEKIKNIVKNKYFRIWIVILLWLFILRESYAVYIDIYNFRQLEKAKPYLETIDKNTKNFFNLKEFNEIYNTSIKPIKNCYSVNTNNWKYIYKFWFKLESYIYIYIYWKTFYIYPWDDIPFSKFCDWWDECIDDINRKWFEEIISNPCKE